MTIVSSGAISIQSLVGEYGGSAPHALSEYYKGGGLVANHSNNPNVPTSGTISLSNFYGANNTSPGVTSYGYSMTPSQVAGTGVRGFSQGAYGALTPNPQPTAFSSGFNPNIREWVTISTIGKGGGIVNQMNFLANGHLPNSGWTNFVIPGSLSNTGTGGTFTRASANYQQFTSGGQQTTRWNFGNIAFYFSTTGTHGITLNQ